MKYTASNQADAPMKKTTTKKTQVEKKLTANDREYMPMCPHIYMSLYRCVPISNPHQTLNYPVQGHIGTGTDRSDPITGHKQDSS